MGNINLIHSGTLYKVVRFTEVSTGYRRQIELNMLDALKLLHGDK